MPSISLMLSLFSSSMQLTFFLPVAQTSIHDCAHDHPAYADSQQSALLTEWTPDSVRKSEINEDIEVNVVDSFLYTTGGRCR